MNQKKNRIMLFCRNLSRVGGSEKLLFEEAANFEKNDLDVQISTFYYCEDVLFNKNYNFKIDYHIYQEGTKSLFLKIIEEIQNVFFLRNKIKNSKPDIILATSSWDCLSLYLATFATRFSYNTHIHGTIFWFQNSNLKYALIHKKVFSKIRNSVIGHKEFIPLNPPKMGLMNRIVNEFHALIMYLAVKKAKKIFVLSKQMKWEVNQLYGKDSIIVKGAFTDEILKYKPKKDIRKSLDLKGKRIILNLNRLDPRKRVDLLIKSFSEISNEFADAVLLIGGTGPEEDKLKTLVRDLKIEDKVKFLGYVKEEDKWEYISACDVFAHPNWADFAIAPFEALALRKKVVWSSEMEIDDEIRNTGLIFSAEPTVNKFAQTIKDALITEISPKKYSLDNYTWGVYCQKVYEELIK